MKSINLFFIALLCIATLFSCKDKPERAPELLSMTFRSATNPKTLKADIPTTITNQEVSVEVPEGLDLSSMAVSFEIYGSDLLINGIKQEANITRSDFSKAVKIEVSGFDGGIATYTFDTKSSGESLKINSFILKQEDNPHLLSDIDFRLENEIFHTVVPKVNGNIVIASIATDAAEVQLNRQSVEAEKFEIDLTKRNQLTLISSNGFKKNYTVNFNTTNEIPHIYLDTENGQPIVVKSLYLQAKIKIDGVGISHDVDLEGRVKGRGNSTWNMPKKPYRIKLNENTSIFGLGAAKDWVLLANHLDYTSLLSATSFKMGQLLQMPYTNTVTPVELTLNGKYQGLYLLTQQVEVKESRINIGKDGVLLELDSYYDEDYKFRSKHFNLPVNIKHPDLNSNAELEAIQKDFQKMEDLIFDQKFPENGYRDLFDVDAFVNFYMVMNLTKNGEINHPKSTYLHKKKDGKYSFGPIWDFDWGYGFDGVSKFFKNPQSSLLRNNSGEAGSPFWRRLLEDPVIKKRLKEQWSMFKSTKLTELYSYIDHYGEWSQDAIYRNDVVWNRMPGSLANDKAQLKAWLQVRASYLDGYYNNL